MSHDGGRVVTLTRLGRAVRVTADLHGGGRLDLGVVRARLLPGRAGEGIGRDRRYPAVERQEIRDIYAAKGFSGDLLDRVVETITANREAWLATMMDEELHLQPVEAPDIFRSAIVITIATLIGHLIPLLPFVWLPRTTALVVAVALSALVLFGVGTYQAVTLVGDWRKKGLQVVAIGLSAAAVGHLFHTVS